MVPAQIFGAPQPPVPASLPSLKVAYTFDSDPSQVLAFNRFREFVRGQQIASLDPIPAYKYGSSDSTVLDIVRKGDVDMAFVPFDVIAKLDPNFAVFTTPFLFDGFDHLAAVQRGSIGQRLLGELRKSGLQGVGWWAGEFVAMAGDRPVVDPRDIADKIIAFQPKTNYGEPKATAVPDFSRILKSVPLELPGTSPDASIFTRGANLVEIAPKQLGKIQRPPTFITITNHLNGGYVVVVNGARWDKLSSSFRDRFPRALQAAYDFNTRELEFQQTALLKGAPGNAAVLQLPRVDRTKWQANFDFPERGAAYTELAALVKSAVVPQLVSTTAPEARISWNAWLEDTSGKDVETLTVGRVSTINLDLGRLPYKRRRTALPDPRLAGALRSDEELHLLIQPVVLGDQLEAAPTATLSERTAVVSLKNEKTLPTDEARRQLHWDGKLSTKGLSAILGLGNIVQWSVKANQEGCATVAFAVWDEARVEPLDYMLVSLPVQTPGGKPVTCYGMSDSQDMAAGIGTLLREPRKGGLIADASLHVFEYEESGGQPYTVAILVHAKRLAAAKNNPSAKDRGVYSWRLVSSLSEFMSNATKLPDFITKAHQAVVRNDPLPYDGVVDSIKTVLFAGKFGHDADQARLAEDALKDAVANGNPAKVFMRLVDKKGQAIYLPLGLLAAHAKTPFVTKRFSVYQTLPGVESSNASCIASWHVARSQILEGAEGVPGKLLTQAPTNVAAPGELLPTHQDVLRYLASQPTAKEGEGFIMLAHHVDDSLRFTSKDLSPPRISSDSVNRNFPASSMGLLAACSTSGAGQTSSFVNRLASQGMSTVIVSPFPVDIEYGVRLALAFEQRALRSPSGATAATLFEQSTADVAASLPTASGLQDMALEFQLAGNPDLAVCKVAKE